MSFDPKEPYNELPLLPPKVELETKTVLKRCVTANRALAELKGTGDLIPNQSVLINVIPLQEAKLSSEIENIVTTQDALFTAALDESRATDLATKEVLRYRTALRRGFETIQPQPLRIPLREALCSLLRDEEVRFRGDEEIMIGNPVTKAITYPPPVGVDLIQAKLRNLEDFLLGTEGDLDPLV